MKSLRQVVKRVLPRPVVDWFRGRLHSGTAKLGGQRPRILPEFGPSADHMIELEAALWATSDHGYVDKLERSVRMTGRDSLSRARGSLALARWDFHNGDIDPALKRLDEIRPSDPALRAEVDLFRADCLCLLGRGQEAMSTLSRMTGRFTSDSNLLLRVGHARSLLREPVDHGSGPVTESLNRIYRAAGVGMIRRSSVEDPIGIDNIACEVPRAEPARSLPLVTVVVLLPEDLPEVFAGLSSLLDQSWPNLEIVLTGGPEVRDRMSADDAGAIDDLRIVVVDEGDWPQHLLAPGLTRASGELVTTHVYGSWAHPQRIEAQATALLAEPTLRSTVACHMKVHSDLDPRPLGTSPRMDLVGPGPHSAMIRRSGLTAEAVYAAYDRVLGSYSPVTGEMELQDDAALVAGGVPLVFALNAAMVTGRHMAVSG